MRIDICIPAYNEEDVIEEAAKSVVTSLRAIPGADMRVVVVDNGSTDRTAERAASISGVSVMKIEERGKGAAITAAARESNADYFGFIDADLSASPDDIATLLKVVQSGEADIAVGSRLLDTKTVQREWLRTLSSHFFNALRRLLLGITVKDSQCGLKMMNPRGREVLAECMEKGWFFDMEFLMRAQRNGLTVREIPIRWDEHHFPGRQSKLRFIRDGFGAVRAMIRIRRSVNS